MLFPAAVHARLLSDPASPLLTWYDEGREGASGERLELSGATAANWAAKVANLLIDECGLDPGDQVAVAAPAHWLTAAMLWGCWAAGATVLYVPAGQPIPAVPVAFVHEPRFADSAAADEVYGLALTAMAGPTRTTGLTDAVQAVRVHGDALPHVSIPDGTPAVAGGPTHATLLAGAAAGRFITAQAWGTPSDVVLAAARPWAAGSSGILFAGAVAQERLQTIRAAERAS